MFVRAGRRAVSPATTVSVRRCLLSRAAGLLDSARAFGIARATMGRSYYLASEVRLHMCQMRAVLSALPVANNDPSWLNATEITGPA